MACTQKRTPVPVKVKVREEKFRLAPKALFALALVEAGLIPGPVCEEVDIAWADFEASMKKWGYVDEQ